MAISFKKYIDITSAVGGAAIVATRDLIGRIFITSDLIPTSTVVTFTTAEDVGKYFGTDSRAYKRAVWYFSFVGKQVTTPKSLSFYRWSNTGEAATIIGGKITGTLSEFQAITAGTFVLQLGGEGNITVSAIDLSTATSFADIAAVLQTAVRAADVNPAYASAIVLYDAANQRFVLTGGAVDGFPVSAAAGTIPTLFELLNWAEGANPVTNARWSDSQLIQTPTQTLDASTSISDNFGSFLFMGSLTDEQKVEIAIWNDLQNVFYMFCLAVLPADATTTSADLIDISGTCMTLIDGTETNTFPEMMPMAILAATDYSRVDAAQNYMFQQGFLTPTVEDTSESNNYDSLRINYYGATQKAGKLIAFYQRGLMTGLSSDPTDMNVYANEMWLKDIIGASLMNMLLALGKISANRQGRGTVLAGIQVGVDQALFNGVISIGKPLTQLQKAYITQVTGSAVAWHQVQDGGYWLDVVISSYVSTETGKVEWKATYTLVYSKDDAIRKVVGSDILI